MRKKIITVAATLLLLGLLSMVEQLSVERLTSEAMEKTQEILFLLAQNEPEQGLERARAMDAWWDEEAPNAEMIINHVATDDVRFTDAVEIPGLVEPVYHESVHLEVP